MFQILGILSGLASAICHLPYIRDTIFNKTKPERATWLIWSVLGSIAFLSQLAKGATNSLWLPFFDTLGVVVIFFLSIKFGVGGLIKRDIVALVVAFLGLILWWFFQEAALALILVIIIDVAGAIPTIIKSYKNPESETLSTWILSSLSGFLGMLAVGSINPVLLVYPIYIWLINLITAGTIILGRRK